MRVRGIVKSADVAGGRACVFLTHVDDVASFAAGDELYTRADVPELLALQLRARGRVTMAEANALYEAAARDHESLTAKNEHTRIALDHFLSQRTLAPKQAHNPPGCKATGECPHIGDNEPNCGCVLCTCRIDGQLQMSAGCALHGEGEPDEERRRGEWTEADYSEAQVDAALSAWGETNWSFLDEDIRRRNTRTMRAALAAASVPAQPKQVEQPLGWTANQIRAAIVSVTASPDIFRRVQRALMADGVPPRPDAELEPALVNPSPDAPTDLAALPDYWDERRKRQGKPDLSRCAAELRVALARSGDRLTEDERHHVETLRECVEHDVQPSCVTLEAALGVFDARFPKPKGAGLGAVAFEASLAAQKRHTIDSDQYWDEIAAAVLAADKAGAK